MKEFDEVIGYDDVKIELERIVDIMLNSKKYQDLGVKTTRGLLLNGNPGVGKTLMAKCFIKASKRKEYTIRKDLPDGEFVKHIKSTFEEASKNAPSIILLDDLDKYANEDSGHKNAEEFITIQSCIDDCKDKEVFILATTNDLEAIPESLYREGRIDKVIMVDNPRGEDAEKIVAHYLKEKKCAGDVNAKEIAKLLDGGSCASLETVINEAGVYAGFENRSELTMKDLVRAFMRVVYKAPEKLKVKDSEYIKQTAYHEAGHAVVGELLEKGSVNFVTIKQHNGNISGLSGFSNNEHYFEDKKFMENRVISLLAGKAATEIVYGITDVGANNDLHRAYDIVGRFVDDYCSFGFSTWESKYREQSQSMLDRKNDAISLEMERYYQKAKKLLIDNRNFLDAVANELIDKQVLLGSDVRRLRTA